MIMNRLTTHFLTHHFLFFVKLTDEEMSGKKLADNQWLGAEAGLWLALDWPLIRIHYHASPQFWRLHWRAPRGQALSTPHHPLLQALGFDSGKKRRTLNLYDHKVYSYPWTEMFVITQHIRLPLGKVVTVTFLKLCFWFYYGSVDLQSKMVRIGF